MVHLLTVVLVVLPVDTPLVVVAVATTVVVVAALVTHILVLVDHHTFQDI